MHDDYGDSERTQPLRLEGTPARAGGATRTTWTQPASAPEHDPGVPAPTRIPGVWRTPRQWPRWVAAGLLCTLGCLLAVMTVVARWTHDEVLDTDRYLTTVGPVATNPIVQDTVARKVAEAIGGRLRESLTDDDQPRGASVLARPLSAGTEQVVYRIASSFTHSEAFRTVWIDVNRFGHQQLVAVLTGRTDASVVIDGNNRVLINLEPVVDAVRARLVAAGVPGVDRLPRISTQLDVGRFDDVDTVRRALQWLDRAARWLPLLTLGCLVAAVWTAPRRRRMVVTAGLGVVAAMAALWIFLAVGCSIAVGKVSDPGLRPAVKVTLNQVASPLRGGLHVVTIMGLFVTMAGLLALSSVGIRLRDALRGRVSVPRGRT